MDNMLKEEGEKVAGMFLSTIPESIFERYRTKNIHHQLAYFYCWIEEMKLMDSEGEFE